MVCRWELHSSIKAACHHLGMCSISMLERDGADLQPAYAHEVLPNVLIRSFFWIGMFPFSRASVSHRLIVITVI